ncbi:hypothetical protein [uncultured Thiodictyon sp.]|uniref:hypothetical protein n=1 Tax=uncultured Thiodictyon sp. TaxID=1846217 RepID=UPI0025D52F6D|nr:hypothetical protein [uncultured Thiodictyon sp.]
MADLTFMVPVDAVGVFECRRRTMRVAVAITAEYNRLTEGAESIGGEFAGICNFLAYLKAMVVRGPDGWDPYAIDPDDEAAVAALQDVYAAIKTAEGRFRKPAGDQPQSASASVQPVP